MRSAALLSPNPLSRDAAWRRSGHRRPRDASHPRTRRPLARRANAISKRNVPRAALPRRRPARSIARIGFAGMPLH
jgi:hypothetical protein